MLSSVSSGRATSSSAVRFLSTLLVLIYSFNVVTFEAALLAEERNPSCLRRTSRVLVDLSDLWDACNYKISTSYALNFSLTGTSLFNTSSTSAFVVSVSPVAKQALASSLHSCSMIILPGLGSQETPTHLEVPRDHGDIICIATTLLNNSINY